MNFLENPREGEVLETWDNIFFDVKGLIHPPDRIVAFIRFFPSADGDRVKDGKKYRKVYSLKDRYRLLEDSLSKYLVYDPVFDEVLCEVPRGDVKTLHDPVDFLSRTLLCREGLDGLSLKAIELAETLKEGSRIPWSGIGISGSVMVGMHNQSSDIDITVYGSKNCLSVYKTLRDLVEVNESVKPYDEEDLKRLFLFRYRDTCMRYEDFKRVESRKVTQGKFKGRDFFVRLVKNVDEESERYGTTLYRRVGWARLKARVVDCSDALFTPCRYQIDDVAVLSGKKVEPILEVASFRGRFCDQAREDETILSQGKLERVEKLGGYQPYYRLLLGGEPSDYMILANDL